MLLFFSNADGSDPLEHGPNRKEALILGRVHRLEPTLRAALAELLFIVLDAFDWARKRPHWQGETVAHFPTATSRSPRWISWHTANVPPQHGAISCTTPLTPRWSG